MLTFRLKAGDIRKTWYVVNAEDCVLGRVASQVSRILRGKHKPTYSPHLDCGDCVIVLNAHKVRLTGNKVEDKNYYWHTGYPGGIKSRSASDILEGRFPERVFESAVRRMMGSKGPLRNKRMGNLYIYASDVHPHAAQNPVALDIASWNDKNQRREERSW